MASIEVVYALPSRQQVVTVPLRPGMTVLAAIEASGLLAEFPEISTRALAVGIHGQIVDPHREVRAGERVEIYRPLQADPREARRRRLSRAGGRRAGPAGR
jgi:uncharacterized protein